MTGGAWLPPLAKKAGLNIPIMPGKGYSFMVDQSAHQSTSSINANEWKNSFWRNNGDCPNSSLH